MTTKKNYEKPCLLEVTIMQQTQLLQNVSVKGWEKGDDKNWGGDEPDEPSANQTSYHLQ